VLPIPRNGPHFCTGYGIELAHIPFEKAAEHLGWVICPMIQNGVNCFEWAQHLFVRCCRFLGMGHVYRSKYTGHVIEMPHIPLEIAAKSLSWATCSTFKYLVNGIEWAQRCSTVIHPMFSIGPSVCLRGAADSLEWAALLDD
jgi:hypothetical protein